MVMGGRIGKVYNFGYRRRCSKGKCMGEMQKAHQHKEGREERREEETKRRIREEKRRRREK